MSNKSENGSISPGDNKTKMRGKIAVLMGSDSDLEKMSEMIPVFHENGIDYEFRVMSAHRTPVIATEFARNAKTNGFDLIIAGAGMSAHLPGVLAAFTGAPVIGIPLKSESSGMEGMDALHSIIQMPPGIPVATVGIDKTKGAAKLAAKMIGCYPACPDNEKKPAVLILHDRTEVSEANLEKVVKTLDIYGISHKVVDQADIGGVTKAAGFYAAVGTFAIINLTGADVESVTSADADSITSADADSITSADADSITNADHYAKKLPIIVVPQNAPPGGLAGTSDMVCYRTNKADSEAFVGVNSYQNAAHLVARVAGIHDSAMFNAVVSEHEKLAAAVIKKDEKIRGDVEAAKVL